MGNCTEIIEQVKKLIQIGNSKDLDNFIENIPVSYYTDEFSKKDFEDSLLHVLMNWKVSANTFRIALENGANPNLLNWKGRTPIFDYFSLERKNENIQKVQLLIQFGADINTIDQNSHTFLMHNFDVRILPFINLKKFNLEHRDYNGNSLIEPIIEAGVGVSDYNGFIKILSAFSNINYYNNLGVTPLHKAALLFRPLAMQALLKSGADASLRTQNDSYSDHSDSEKLIPAGLTPLEILEYFEDNHDLLLPANDQGYTKYVTIDIMLNELKKTKNILQAKYVRIYPYFITNICQKLNIPIGY